MSNTPTQQDFQDAAQKGFDEFKKDGRNYGGSFETFVCGFCSGAAFAAEAAQKILIAQAINIHIQKIGEESK